MRYILILLVFLNFKWIEKPKTEIYFLYALESKFQLKLDDNDSILEMKYLQKVKCNHRDSLQFDMSFFIDSFKSNVIKTHRTDSLLSIYCNLFSDTSVVEFKLVSQEKMSKQIQMDGKIRLKDELKARITKRLDAYNSLKGSFVENYFFRMFIYQSILLEHKVDPEICYDDWCEINK